MRRLCAACNREYKHDEVTASGNDDTGARRHFIACSWACLVDQMLTVGIHFSLPAAPAYE